MAHFQRGKNIFIHIIRIVFAAYRLDDLSEQAVIYIGIYMPAVVSRNLRIAEPLISAESAGLV